MSCQVKVIAQYIKTIGKICNSQRFNPRKTKFSNYAVFTFANENQKDFITQCVADLMGRTSSDVWTPGTMIMGKDRSYERSFYEVLADNGVFVLMICRKLNNYDFPEEKYAMIAPKEAFSVNTDHQLKPSFHSIKLELPENWVVDYKKIKAKRLTDNRRIQVVMPYAHEVYGSKVYYNMWLENRSIAV